MKIVKKEVVILNEKEKEAVNLLKQLCSAISNQSITYELTDIAKNIRHYLTIFSEDWVEEDLDKIYSDYDEDEDDDDDYKWYEDDDEDDDDDEW